MRNQRMQLPPLPPLPPLVPLIVMVLILAGFGSCNQGNIVANARDSAAALGGAIKSAQAQYQAECIADNQKVDCQTINRAVQAQNLLITATETYCGWSPTVPPPTGQQCIPVATAKDGLTAAISNANAITLQLKGIIKP